MNYDQISARRQAADTQRPTSAARAMLSIVHICLVSPLLHFDPMCTYHHTMAGIALTTPAQIGAAIRSARRRAGLTQQQLAERAGVSRRWLIALESGHSERAELGKVLDTLDTLGLDLTVTTTPRATSRLTDVLEGL